jgi:hypothetical protein
MIRRTAANPQRSPSSAEECYRAIEDHAARQRLEKSSSELLMRLERETAPAPSGASVSTEARQRDLVRGATAIGEVMECSRKEVYATYAAFKHQRLQRNFDPRKDNPGFIVFKGRAGLCLSRSAHRAWRERQTGTSVDGM